VVTPRGLIGVIDLGGTKIYSAVLDGAGADIRGEDLRSTGTRLDPTSVLEQMQASMQAAAALAGTNTASLASVGVAAPGPVQADTGRLLYPPNLVGWTDVPLAALLSKRIGCRVVVENDANAAALGEYVAGQGQGAQSMVYVTVSTGIGGGIVIGGRLYRGMNGAAGEIGHMTLQPNGPRCNCGRLGCLEALASGTAIARDGRLALGQGRAPVLHRLLQQTGGAVTSELVAAAAYEGDDDARAIIRDAGKALGIGLASIVDLLNPDVIVVGGGAAKIGPSFLQPAESTMREAIFAKPAAAVELRTASLEYPAIAGMAALLAA
jgi:glucokinase